MKNLNIFLIIVLVGVLCISGCKKDPDLRIPDLKKGIVPFLQLGAGTTSLIDYNNQQAFTGAIVVDVYWKTDLPKSMDLVVAYNNNPYQVGVVQANITVFPTTVNFTFQNILDALGIIDTTLVTSDKFDFYANVTYPDGTVQHGIDTLYQPYSPDVQNYPGGCLTLRYGFFCPLNINDFVGPYNCDEAGYGVYAVNFTLDTLQANTILNDNFWDWAAPGAIVYYVLSGDLDQIVTVPDQPFTFGDGTVGSVSGSGTYDGCLGTMIVDYDVNYGGDIYPTHHVFTPAGKSTYTVKVPKSQLILH
jgi:hypothetical protein